MTNVDEKDEGRIAVDISTVDELDLQKYLRIVFTHKWKIILVGLAAGAVAALTLFRQPLQYKAEAVISFDVGQANVVSVKEVYENEISGWDYRQTRDYLQTQAELIKSRLIIDRVIDKLQLMHNRDFNPAINNETNSSRREEPSFQAVDPGNGANLIDPSEDIAFPQANLSTSKKLPNSRQNEIRLPDLIVGGGSDGAATEEQNSSVSNNGTSENVGGAFGVNSTAPEGDNGRNLVSAILGSRISVEHVASTQLIKVGFVAKDPKLAATVANTIVDVYLESRQQEKRKVTQRANSWLTDRLNSLRVTLELSEQELQDFRKQENLLDIEGVRSLASQELNETSVQLMEARRQLQKIASVRTQFKQRETDLDALAALPRLQDHNVIQSIKRVEANAILKREELSLRYGPKHPKMIAVNSEIDSIRKQLNVEVQQLIAGVESEYQAALAHEAALLAELDKVKNDYQKISQKNIRHNELKHQVDVNRNLYNTFLTRVKETSEASGFEADKARLADPAIAPRSPVATNRNLIIVLAICAGIAIGAALAVIYELIWGAVNSRADVEVDLRKKLFGIIPKLPKHPNERLALRTYFDVNEYRFAEAVRTLRTSLILYCLENSSKLVAITSSIPGEGKTTVAENLAFSLAQIERVLLVDADIRRPKIGSDFLISKGRPGLTDFLLGSATLVDSIFHDDKSGLDVLPAGRTVADAQTIIGSVGFSNCIAALAEKYDRIIIDTPPVQAVSDALIISRLADVSLYVIEAHSTSKRLVGKALERLSTSGSRVDGVILNHIDSRSSAYKDDYYSDRYGYIKPDEDTDEGINGLGSDQVLKDNGAGGSSVAPEADHLSFKNGGKKLEIS